MRTMTKLYYVVWEQKGGQFKQGRKGRTALGKGSWRKLNLKLILRYKKKINMYTYYICVYTYF